MDKNGIMSTNLLMDETISFKELVPYGVSVCKYLDAQDALGHTYTTKDGGFPPTPFISDINPYNQDILDAKFVLEIGCGVGRNLPFIMEHTNAQYYGVDPTEEMTQYFWEVQDKKWQDRVTICKSFNDLPEDIKFDFVIVVFVFQHIGFRPKYGQMNVVDITLEAMKYTCDETVWFVLEHEREEMWQEEWLQQCNITPAVYYKPNGDHTDGGTIPYPEFEIMTHRGNDNNLIIFKEGEK